jgi:hypothetical protein
MIRSLTQSNLLNSNALSPLLLETYRNHEDLQSKFNIDSQENCDIFTCWWLKWKAPELPSVYIDYAITKERLLKLKKLSDKELPLFESIKSFENRSIEYSEIEVHQYFSHEIFTFFSKPFLEFEILISSLNNWLNHSKISKEKKDTYFKKIDQIYKEIVNKNEELRNCFSVPSKSPTSESENKNALLNNLLGALNNEKKNISVFLSSEQKLIERMIQSQGNNNKKKFLIINTDMKEAYEYLKSHQGFFDQIFIIDKFMMDSGERLFDKDKCKVLNIENHDFSFLPFFKKRTASNFNLFLRCIYDWRSDIRESLNYSYSDRTLLKWWLKWGVKNYPQVPLDVCIFEKKDDPNEYMPHLCSLINTRVSSDKRNEVIEFFFKHQLEEYFSGPIFNIDLIYEKLKFWVDKNIDNKITRSFFLNKIGSHYLKTLSFNKCFKLINQTESPVIIGVPQLSIGIGEDARLLSLVTERANINTEVSEESLISRNLNIFALPAPDIFIKLTHLNSSILKKSYNIASCPWELPYWPKSLEFILDFFEEIWVHSEFVRESIPSKYKDKVYKYPQPVKIYSSQKEETREYFNLKDDVFYFLISFDFSSRSKRKNPELPIECVRELQKELPDKSVGLIIKTNNSNDNQREYLKTLTKGLRNVVTINEQLSPVKLHNLYKLADAYVSLHRSEGFGRNIAEFMLLKKPCIVTNFSGNTDFCTPNTSYLVDYKKIDLQPSDYIFSENQYWAEPCRDSAIAQMKKVFTSIDKEKLKNAFENIKNNYSLTSSAKFVKERMEAISKQKKKETKVTIN